MVHEVQLGVGYYRVMLAQSAVMRE